MTATVDHVPVTRPFAVAPVRRIRFVDTDDPIELRDIDALLDLTRPDPRPAPTRRPTAAADPWIPGGPDTEPRRRGRVARLAIETAATLVVFSGVITGATALAAAYQHAVG